MRNQEDAVRARLTVTRQLQRRDIGPSHQRAYLQGLLSALEWSEGASNGNAKALQRLLDGHEITVSNAARIAGPPSARALGRAGLPDLRRQYEREMEMSHDVICDSMVSAGYVAWLESKLTGVGLVVA